MDAVLHDSSVEDAETVVIVKANTMLFLKKIKLGTRKLKRVLILLILGCQS